VSSADESREAEHGDDGEHNDVVGGDQSSLSPRSSTICKEPMPATSKPIPAQSTFLETGRTSPDSGMKAIAIKAARMPMGRLT